MVCPNCGAEIERFDLSVNCKKCGVNLYFASQEKLLGDDAKKCELEFASMRAFTAKLKAAFIGSAPAVARIVFTVLCVAALLVPFATLKAEIPLYSAGVSFGAIGLYNAYSDGFLMLLPDYLKVSVTHDIALKSIMLIGTMVLLVLIVLALLLSELLSFINIKKSAGAMRIISGIGVAVSVISAVFSFMLGSATSFEQLDVTASASAGSFVCLAMFVGMMIINHIFIKRDIKPIVKQVDLQRIEIGKKLKRGEITLDELSLPVLESDEERQARLEQEEKVREIEAKYNRNNADAEGKENG